MRKYALLGAILVVALLSGCASTPVDSGPAYKSRTTSEGLVAMSGVEINDMFRGTAFQSHAGEWTWVFGVGGTAHSRAYDGSWEVKDQKWDVDGNKLCRDVDGAYPCVAIYAVDGVIRFGMADSNELEPWAIVPYVDR